MCVFKAELFIPLLPLLLDVYQLYVQLLLQLFVFMFVFFHRLFSLSRLFSTVLSVFQNLFEFLLELDIFLEHFLFFRFEDVYLILEFFEFFILTDLHLVFAGVPGSVIFILCDLFIGFLVFVAQARVLMRVHVSLQIFIQLRGV